MTFQVGWFIISLVSTIFKDIYFHAVGQWLIFQLQSSQRAGNNTIMMGCTPEIGDRHSVCTLKFQLSAGVTPTLVSSLSGGHPSPLL
jgi:hypothetical protein